MTPSSSSSFGSDREGVRSAIAIASGGSDDLTGRYAAYARQLWDQTAWTAPLLVQPFYLAKTIVPFWDEYTAVEVRRSASDTGERVTGDLDHLASCQVRVTSSLAGPTGPGDRLRVSVRDPRVARDRQTDNSAGWQRWRPPRRGAAFRHLRQLPLRDDLLRSGFGRRGDPAGQRERPARRRYHSVRQPVVQLARRVAAKHRDAACELAPRR